ncbi:ribonuclease J [bacterium]|nr:ribonuclease J [bacterium]
MKKNDVDFSWLSLGGIGEIGKNCYVLNVAGKLLIIDVGMSFPDMRDFGVDVVIPDFTYLVKNQHRVAGIILTHGHEDHIGGLAYLLQDLTKIPPIYGSKFTLGLLRGKLAEFDLGDTELTQFKPGDDLNIGGIDVQTLRVTHSIPDACSVAVHTPVGIYLHSGDVKLDPTPVDGRTTDFDKLASIGDQGVTVLSMDVTNIERTGLSGSETSVRPALRDYVAQHRGRVFLTTFASNIHRIQQMIDIAVELNRKVLVLGRTMVDNTAMSQDLGYLKVPPNVLIHPTDVDKVKPHRLMVILTGSQGEPLAAISKLASGEHRFLTVSQDDLFIFSASPIPGNETAIYSVIDDLFKKGAEVIYGLGTGAHVSGHGNQEEIREYVQIARPTFAIPTHGEYRMQMRFKKLAPQWGIDEANVPIVDRGEVWAFNRDTYQQIDTVKTGAIFIGGDGGADISRRMINERLALAQDGVLVFTVVLSADGERIVAGPDLMNRGFLPEKQAPELYVDLREEIAAAILKNRQRTPEFQLQLRNNVQNAIQRVIFQKTRINPTVLGMVSYAGK